MAASTPEPHATPSSPAVHSAHARAGQGVRPLEERDLERVADIFLKTFRRGVPTRKGEANRALADYMRGLYLSGPALKPGGGSLVHADGSGTVTGFLGGLQSSFDLDGERLTARALSAYMVDEAANDPIAGVALMRAYFNGPHDFYFSDTANPLSFGIARLFKCEVMTAHSLEWVRVFRPAGLALRKAGTRWPMLPTVLFRQPVLLADRIARRLMPKSPTKLPPAGVVDEAVSREEMAALLPKFAARYRLRPAWPPEELTWYLDQAALKRGNGPLQGRVVREEGGADIGCYLFYGEPDGIVQVVQVLAGEGRLGTVVTSLMRTVEAMGCVAARGQASPELLKELYADPAVFYHCIGAALLRTRRADVMAAMRGEAMLAGGLFGDRWTRLASDRF